MHPRFVLRLFTVVAAACLVSACISPKSFVDPSSTKYKYEDVKKPASPAKLRLVTEFQRNGEPLPKADAVLKDNVERILRASGVIISTPDSADGQVKVTVNNVADRGSAVAKGVGTGLTFGLVGTTVADAYELTLSISSNGKTYTGAVIKNQIFTTIGNASAPDGVETVPVSVASQRVLEQMLLRAIKEAQEGSALDAKLDKPSVIESVESLARASLVRHGAA